MSDTLGTLWKLLTACEEIGLISFNYPIDQIKTKFTEHLKDEAFEEEITNKLYRTPSPPATLCQTPPMSSTTKYRIVEEIQLTKDRRKTLFNFNLPFSDDEEIYEDIVNTVTTPDNINTNHGDHTMPDNVVSLGDDPATPNNVLIIGESATPNNVLTIEESATPNNVVTIGDSVTPNSDHDDSRDTTSYTERLESPQSSDDSLEHLFSQIRIQSEKKKARRFVSRRSLDAFIVSDSEEISDDDSVSPLRTFSPIRSKNRTPLAPVNSQQQLWVTPVAQVEEIPSLTTPSAHKSVSRSKSKMASELYEVFNKTVFDDKLPANMDIVWNKKLRTTAAYCAYLGTPSNRSAHIEMSPKVCDTYDRIKSTLIHEMCHAATWIIDGTRRAGHGPLWKAWGRKANYLYPELSPITRCHSFEISYKYTYHCTKCDFKIGRHSKSIKIPGAVCPCCLSSLALSYN